jgi:hypothetical protein
MLTFAGNTQSYGIMAQTPQDIFEGSVIQAEWKEAAN